MGFSLPFLKKKPEKHVYFGLYFTESRITGFAFDIDAGKANILSQNAYDISAGYEKMLEDTDNLISDLEQKTKLSLDKTIFFLHSTMLDANTRDIVEPHKDTLKRISRELELEPMGYIDLHEAIEGNLKANSVINNVLVELSPTKLAVFIYKGGVMTAKQTISRTDSVAADLDGALKSLPEKVILPSKIMIYGVGDLTQASADIAQYKWDTKVFMHHPTLEVLEDIPLYQILGDTFVEELLTQDDAPVISEKAETPIAPAAATPNVPQTTMPFGFTSSTDQVSQPVVEKPLGLSNVSLPLSGLPPSSPKEAPPSDSPAKNWLSGIAEHFSVKPAHGNKRPLILAGVGAGVLLLLASVFVGYEYVAHAATVEITVPTKELENDFEMTLPIVDRAAGDKLVLIKHTKVIEYDEEKNTTGKRDVGEKAKGDIILHNFDNEERTIANGTELKAGNLIFILDADVKVASSSGISSDGIKQSGKQKASVTAKEIGQEYNVSKGTQMNVGSLSNSLFVGIADEAFSGGSKKQVTTVSKTDMDALKKTVEEEIKKQAETEVEKLVEGESDIIPELTLVDITDTEYSGEVGEEANSITVKASSEISYYTVDTTLLQKKLHELLSKEKESGHTISEDHITYTVGDTEMSEDEDEVVMTFEAVAKQYKDLDMEKIKEQVTFKQVSSIKSQVAKDFDIEDITVTPTGNTLPFTTSWLPLFKKNISVTISMN